MLYVVLILRHGKGYVSLVTLISGLLSAFDKTEVVQKSTLVGLK